MGVVMRWLAVKPQRLIDRISSDPWTVAGSALAHRSGELYHLELLDERENAKTND